MCANYAEWDEYYRKCPLSELGWELGKPRSLLVEFVEKGLVGKGTALDLCCGAGTNTMYLAKNGFEVTGLDISLTALEIAKKKAERANVSLNQESSAYKLLMFLAKGECGRAYLV